jgi:E3 ubiquitin-protein ligase BRE1
MSRPGLFSRLQVVNSKMDRLKRMGGEKALSADVSRELEAMRMLLRCNVCHERTKDVIITKCWHIFCSPCIQRNLETRNRKCPGCGVAFGQHDVKPFYFT